MDVVYLKDSPPLKNTAIALGTFDGVHIAHKKLIFSALDYAKNNGLLSSVLIFNKHPLNLLLNENVKEITPFEKKVSIIKSLGVDICFVINLDEKILKMEPEYFVKDVLLDRLRAKYLVAGYNYHFGKGARGNFKMLEKYASVYDFKVKIIDEIKKDNISISSTHIRSLIKNGEISKANDLLGHTFSILGNVKTGKKIGKIIGFPTVNIYPEQNQITPKNGVYLTKTKVFNKFYNSISNVGVNPTFGGENKRIETHIFDFDDNLYSKDVEVFFLKHIRDEIKFENIDKLKAQIKQDTEIAKNMFDICHFLC